DWGFEGDGVEEEERPDFAPQPEEEGEGRRSRRRRRRGRRDGREEARASSAQPEPVAEAEMSSPDTPQAEPPWAEIEPAAAAATEPPGVGEQPSIPDGPGAPGDDEREERRGRRGRRRGRRGGRRGRDRDGQRAHTEEARDEDRLDNGANHEQLEAASQAEIGDLGGASEPLPAPAGAGPHPPHTGPA